MSSISFSNKNDDIVELNPSNFSKASPFSFNIPSKKNNMKKSEFRSGDDILFNRNKISNDIVSMSSMSSASSSASSCSSESSSQPSNRGNKNIKKINKIIEDDDDEDEDDDDDDDDVEVDDENDEDDDGDDEEISNHRNERPKSYMSELNEKREILYQMERLESKGYRLPIKFNMQSNLEEMKLEYEKIIREKEVDSSVRFQRKMLMAFVTGTEYLNTRYDPFSARLEGWSEQVHENINDYDDIFEELHEKYKSTGKKMSPELRLFISLSGSAFMFHLTSRMFKESPLPNVEEVLKSNPELMKQFQAAAAKQYIMGNNHPQTSKQIHQSNGNMNSNSTGSNGGASSGMGLFSMVSNLFSNLGDSSQPQNNTRQYQQKDKPSQDIDSIINNVHNKISTNQELNNIETLSVSDEEITSIIEDTADIKILRSNKKNKNSRTLNL